MFWPLEYDSDWALTATLASTRTAPSVNPETPADLSLIHDRNGEGERSAVILNASNGLEKSAS